MGVKVNGIFHVYEDRHGVTWYCTEIGVARSKGGQIERLSPYGARENSAFRAYEDASRTVWIAKYDALLRVTDGGLELALSNLHSRYLTFDRDEDLWVGTNGGGLIKFKKSDCPDVRYDRRTAGRYPGELRIRV